MTFFPSPTFSQRQETQLTSIRPFPSFPHSLQETWVLWCFSSNLGFQYVMCQNIPYIVSTLVPLKVKWCNAHLFRGIQCFRNPFTDAKCITLHKLICKNCHPISCIKISMLMVSCYNWYATFMDGIVALVRTITI